MDKYEYQLKTEHIRQVAARKEYEEAARLCDTIDWTKVRDVKMLTFTADIYTAVGEYENAIDILQQAYQYAAMGRRIVYRLTELALKAGNYDEAKNYFEEFCRIAPNDQGRYILLYKMARFKKATLEEKIQILEAYKKEDFDEKWAYELAVLYAMNNEKDKCIQLCDDIILWFGLGKYVEKALSLKSQFAPLTPAQKEKVQKFADKKAEEENEKLQEAQKKQEEQKLESVQVQKKAAQEKILKWQAEQEAAYQAEQEVAKQEAKAREEEQLAAREREEQLRLQREEEKALKEEKEREEARKVAERLREQKAREEQERLQREQEELEAVERLKRAQRLEHARRSVVTSDINEIMATIQRAKQEDAQSDLRESLAKQVQEVQKQVAAEQVEMVEDKPNVSKETMSENVQPEVVEEPEIEEVKSKEAEEPEIEEVKSEEAEEPEIEEVKSEEAEEPEIEEVKSEKIEELESKKAEADEMPELTSNITASVEESVEEQTSETVQYAQEETEEPEGEQEWFEDYKSGEEPQISEWAAPKAEAVAFEEAEAAENAEVTPTEISLVEEESGEYPEFEPEKEESKDEAFGPEEEVDPTMESDKELDLETQDEQYEETRQPERVSVGGLPIVNPENMSRVWHFAIQAMPDEDDIELALDYLQELSDSSSRVVPQSVVKITGQKLNQKGVVRSFDKLLGKTILIENAADMSDRVIDELCQVIDPNDRSLLVVFIDTPASIRHLLLDHPALSSVVTAQFVRENYSVTELLEYARGYADREDSVLDKSGELELMERLKVIAENQERNKKRIVEMIVNNAIENAEKKSMRRLFQSKYDKRGCLILRDKDFQVS